MIGRTFSRLTVVEEAGRSSDGKKRIWKCLCVCGKHHLVRQNNLTSGGVQSCGCLNRDLARVRSTRHGDSTTRLYRLWTQMRERCRNPSAKYHGARGITVCDEWQDWPTFKDWAVSSGYADNLTIDRVDNDAGYTPDNCRWTSRVVQARNTRRVKLSETKAAQIRTDNRPRSILAKEYGVASRTISRVRSHKIWANIGEQP